MFKVYVLYSFSAQKFYTGYSNDILRRLHEHNVTETKGFTLRYRPWTLIHTELLLTKQDAMRREKYLKTGVGREQLKIFLQHFLDKNDAVSAGAEKG